MLRTVGGLWLLANNVITPIYSHTSGGLQRVSRGWQVTIIADHLNVEGLQQNAATEADLPQVIGGNPSRYEP